MDRMEWYIDRFCTKVDSLISYFYRKGSQEDPFRLAELILTLGGFHFESPNRWANVLWHLYPLFAILHSTIIVLNLIESIHNENDAVAMIWFMLLLVFIVSGIFREFVLRPRIESIFLAKSFINSSSIVSSDTQYDEKMRIRVSRKVRMICVGILMLVLVCILSVPFLMIYEDRFYGLPKAMQDLFGPTVSIVLQVIYNLSIFPLWGNKVFGPTVVIAALLSGFHSEYQIMARGFGTFVHEIKSAVNGSSFGLKHINKDAFWRNCKLRTRFHVDQHILVLKNLKQLAFVIRKLYFIIHYCAMVLIGLAIFVLLMEGTLTSRMILVMSLVNFAAECYWWCSLAESFKEINQTMEEYIFDLLLTIPYHEKFHSDYVELRTMLMIFKINIRNGAQFTCGGVFVLSMEAFVHIVNTSYFVLTFLMNVR